MRFLAADLAVSRHWEIGEERFKRATEKAGWLHDRNALGVRFVGLRPASQLEEELEWHRANGAWIYEALGRLHPESIEDRIEADLDEDFAALRDADLRSYVDAVRTRIAGEPEKRGGGQLDTKALAQLQKAVETATEKYEESWTDDLEALS